MKSLLRSLALPLVTALVFIAATGCARQSAATAEKLYEEIYEKTNEHAEKAKSEGHGKKDEHPAAGAEAPKKFIEEKK